MRTASLVFKTVALSSVLILSACGPAEAVVGGTEEGGEEQLGSALTIPAARSNLTYLGTKVLMTMSYLCLERAGSGLAVGRCSATNSNGSFALYRTSLGTVELCVPGSLMLTRELRNGVWYEQYVGNCVERQSSALNFKAASVLSVRRLGATGNFSSSGEAFQTSTVEQWWTQFGVSGRTEKISYPNSNSPGGAVTFENSRSGIQSGLLLKRYVPCDLGSVQWCLVD